MNFVTISFVLFFLPVLCIGWWLRPRNTVYRWFLLAANLIFYALAGGGYLLLLLFLAMLNWGCVRLMERRGMRQRLRLVSFTVALHVITLAFFKYYEPVFTWFAELLGMSPEALVNPWLSSLVMPIGLSFYTFQGLSYTIDHYRDEGLAPRSYADVLSYMAFFPTVMSGPIMREDNFFPQLRTSYAGEEDFSEGITLVLSGLFKKVVLATYLQTHLVDGVFSSPGEYSSLAALMGVYAYTVQIYCDFSGYTDMALGVGRLMGFHLPRNFNAPYRALNLQDFWHRWHISLSTWLRDYLYIPLGGSRKGNRYVNLIITMVIGGMWHGSSWSFVVWGLFHGIGLAVVHAWHKFTKLGNGLKAPQWLSVLKAAAAWLLTLHFVALLWVFFRANTCAEACAVLERIADASSEGAGFSALVPVAAVWGLGLALSGGQMYRAISRTLGALPWPVQALLAGLAGAFILNMGPEGTLPFIYQNF